MSRININDALTEYETLGWEEFFGTDSLCPAGHEFEGLPYWVEYMPRDKQQEYISLVEVYLWCSN